MLVSCDIHPTNTHHSKYRRWFSYLLYSDSHKPLQQPLADAKINLGEKCGTEGVNTGLGCLQKCLAMQKNMERKSARNEVTLSTPCKKEQQGDFDVSADARKRTSFYSCILALGWLPTWWLCRGIVWSWVACGKTKPTRKRLLIVERAERPLIFWQNRTAFFVVFWSRCGVRSFSSYIILGLLIN